ncbi:gas vesicle protein GvpG [Marinactinospora thermotolerans]|uniref:Short C-terminal domain-containing protein n=1 Tax=Marinactinospora thermotolerans DSM 45154 TaxID=1122192 RepID=A0A1T4P2L6_9ACTN|nr:gas vesicle protein GvpG [Marinactinospora thermotolerans]SJZ85567.1 Short C-terminal domain-containing protein [Marinactinospora thermotolerans DSM 45154]
MGLFSALLGAPLAPARFVGWTARQVLDAAERQYYDPDAIRAELAELSERLDAGELTEDEFDRMEDELLDRLEEAMAYRAGQ